MKEILSKYTFDELLQGLNNEITKNTITKKTNGNLSLFTYTQECQFSRLWNDFTLISRGLILDEKNKKIVAIPFKKFFNYGEIIEPLPDESFEVSEKMDGSLGIIYYYDSKWNVATKGSFNSEQAIWAKNWLYRYIDTNKLFPEITYLTEIIYRENRIVVRYVDEGLFLLAAFNNITFDEIDRTYLNNFANFIRIRKPKIYHYTINELLDLSKTLSSDHEGFVIRFKNGKRLKIKGDEYCRIHKLISQITPLAIWDIIRFNQNNEELKKNIPEEYLIDYNNIEKIIISEFEKRFKKLIDFYDETVNLTNKELGLSIKEISKDDSRRYVFQVRKYGRDEIKNNLNFREGFFRLFRPTGNHLEGYVPTNAINRFEEEN